MPEPVKRNQRYMPGLDGLRAIAVLSVILFHLGFDWAPGGMLGVGVFFTLSGYLITDILLAQLNARGRIKLTAFWLARARRLLPALFLMLAIVVAWVTIFGPAQPDEFRKGVVSAVFYVNNWQQIFAEASYFARFEAEGPLDHLWSLSVEEQFYILWPFLLLVGVKLVHERPLSSGVRPRLALLAIVGALASSILMAVLYKPSFDPSRLYFGTDTRAAALLFGAALAMVWPSRKLSRRIAPQARNTLDALGVAGLLIIALMIWRVGELSPFLYRGGFVILSLATVMVLMPLTHPACRLGRWLGVRPLRWVGVRSYGIYLWQTPVIVLTTPQGIQDDSLVRAALQVAAIFAIAALSWRFVEEPIRHGAIGRFFARRRAVGWKWETFAPAMRVAIVGLVLVLVVAAAGMAGLNSSSAEGNERPRRAGARRGHDEAAAADQGAGRRLDQILLQSRRPHRRLDLRGSRRRRIPADRIAADPRPLRRSRRQRSPHGGAGRDLDRRALRRQPQRPGSRRRLEGRRLQRLLGARPRHQRGGQRRRRLDRHRARTDRKNDDDHRRRTGALGQRPLAGRSRAIPTRRETWRSGTRNWSPPAPPTRTCASTTGPPTSKTTGSSKTASTSPRPATPPAPQLIANALAHAFPEKGETEGGSKDCVVS